MSIPSSPALPGALLLTQGLFTDNAAKTAHGLVRHSQRFSIMGLIDPPLAGKDAGEALDGHHRGIPAFASLGEALAALPEKPQWAIVAVATPGGILPEALTHLIEEAVQNGLSVLNGLHDLLTDRPRLVTLAQAQGVELLDIRKPKPRRELHFWSGSIFTVPCPIIAVLGVDCAVGKRTTARMLANALTHRGCPTEMIYTGQTGWMQGGTYGFIFDATPNDFVSGELEHAIVSCWQETRPACMLLEGQSALLNPSGPCGSEFILSGNARKVILQLAPARTCFKGWDEFGLRIPPVETHIHMVNLYGAEVMALTLNTKGMTAEAVAAAKQDLHGRTGLPVYAPVEDGMEGLADQVQNLLAEGKNERI